MTTNWTKYTELNDVLESFKKDVETIVADRLVGIYLQGSFAIREGDMHSDCDFVVVLERDLEPEQIGRLALLHDQIPRRPDHWSQHLEGSYAIVGDLRDLSGLGSE